MKSVFNTLWGGFSIDSGNAMIDQLFSRGGMNSMSGTAFMVIIAMGLFGILAAAGTFEVLLTPLFKKVKSSFGASVLSFLIALLVNIGGTTTFSLIFTGETMSSVYDEMKLNRLNLGCGISIGSLLFCCVIPWHTNALPPATYLGVELGQVIPHMFMPFVMLAVYLAVSFFESRRSAYTKK